MRTACLRGNLSWSIVLCFVVLAEADATLAAQAKLRSKHNTFMVVPVVFIMISNHFPVATYGSHYNWIILLVLILAGWITAKFLGGA